MNGRITIDSVRETLEQFGACCPIDTCNSDDVRIVFEPGTQTECGKEHYTCSTCSTEWSVLLYPAKIERILTSAGHQYNYYSQGPGIERGALAQMACPQSPVKDALIDLVKQMRMGSIHKKGEAIARLAFLARVDLSSLSGSQPEEPQVLPSEAE